MPTLNVPWRALPAPLSLTSMFTLIFYWHESMAGANLKLSLKVERFKIPLYVLVFFLFAVEIVIDIFYWMDKALGNSWLAYLQSVYYGVVGIGLSLFYIVTASRILRQLHVASHRSASQASTTESATKRKEGRMNARSAAVKLIIIGAIILLMVSGALSTLSSGYMAGIPSWLYAVWYVIHCLLLMKSLATVFLLRVRPVPKPAQSGPRTSQALSSSDSQM